MKIFLHFYKTQKCKRQYRDQLYIQIFFSIYRYFLKLITIFLRKTKKKFELILLTKFDYINKEVCLSHIVSALDHFDDMQLAKNTITQMEILLI